MTIELKRGRLANCWEALESGARGLKNMRPNYPVLVVAVRNEVARGMSERQALPATTS